MIVYQNSCSSMGTRFNLLLPGIGGPEGDLLFSSVVKELNRLENMLSCFIPSSDICYINQKAFMHPVKIEQELYTILQDCKNYHHITQGLFDIGIGKLIDYWKGNQNGHELDLLMSGNGMEAVTLDEKNSSIRFLSPNVQLNLGGYGKGYALGKTIEILKKRHVSSAFLSFGESSVACIGKHPHGDYWPVGIQDYYKKEQVLKTLKLVDQSIATSGNLDQEYHIIHPVSGAPVKGKMILTVKSKSAVEAEVLSTVLIMADKNQMNSILEQVPGLEVIKASYTNEKVALKVYN